MTRTSLYLCSRWNRIGKDIVPKVGKPSTCLSPTTSQGHKATQPRMASRTGNASSKYWMAAFRTAKESTAVSVVLARRALLAMDLLAGLPPAFRMLALLLLVGPAISFGQTPAAPEQLPSPQTTSPSSQSTNPKLNQKVRTPQAHPRLLNGSGKGAGASQCLRDSDDGDGSVVFGPCPSKKSKKDPTIIPGKLQSITEGWSPEMEALMAKTTKNGGTGKAVQVIKANPIPIQSGGTGALISGEVPDEDRFEVQELSPQEVAQLKAAANALDQAQQEYDNAVEKVRSAHGQIWHGWCGSPTVEVELRGRYALVQHGRGFSCMQFLNNTIQH